MLNKNDYNIEYTQEARGHIIDLLNQNKLKILSQSKVIEKNTSIKEIRLRGFQKKNDIKIGVRINEDVRYGELLCLIGGILYNKFEIKSIQNNSYFVYFFEECDLVIFSPTKPFRKGCRPNATVKLLKCDNILRIGVFSTKNINKNEEIIVDFDYDNGNNYIKYVCNCNNTEFCLNPKIDDSY